VISTASHLVLQLGGLLPSGTRVDVFSQIYWVFLVLGTLIGVIVIGYMLYNAYKYRDDGKEKHEDVDRPELGELPEGGGKGSKLFLSFALSALVVVSLIIWTYGMLLYVETGTQAGAQAQVQGQQQGQGPMTVDVEGYRFGWTFIYPNGHEATTLRVPKDRRIRLNITSRDVFHNFGIPEFRVKADAIPGESTRTWFEAEQTGEYEAICYELCGSGHSYMRADVVVMERSEFQDWYAQTNGTQESSSEGGSGESGEHSSETIPVEVSP